MRNTVLLNADKKLTGSGRMDSNTGLRVMALCGYNDIFVTFNEYFSRLIIAKYWVILIIGLILRYYIFFGSKRSGSY